MSTINLSSHSRETLEHLLKMLKSYKNGLRQIGKRATLIDPLDPPAIQAVVEMHSGMSEDAARQYADSMIRYAFPAYTGDSPIVRTNDVLKGGARVFVGDDMVDVSMQKFESLLK